MIRAALAFLLTASAAFAGGYVPKPLEFPPVDQATFLSGELVLVDPINRRGAIRLDTGGNEQLAQGGPLHYFAMLPCGEIWRHGAPATLQDLPWGTHVQGYFFLPPAGEEKTIAPPPEEFAAVMPKENHALLLEDDLSFYKRQGQSWKVLAVDFGTSKLQVEASGPAAKHGLASPQTLDFDIASRVWKAGRPVEMQDVKPGAVIQINFGRGINWRDNEFGVNEIWLDEESQAQAKELQRRQNVRFNRIRWLPARIDAVENYDYGGGLLTLSIFGGVPTELLDNLKADQAERLATAGAEPSLRTWTHRSDRVFGKIVKWETLEPVPGFSGVRLQVKFGEILDHFRPGNAVRIKAESWLWISNTPEERVRNLDDRDASEVLRLPQQTGAK